MSNSEDPEIQPHTVVPETTVYFVQRLNNKW